ncbi:hypothetical protein TcasGA2_TC007524 [Tribolium castaneum]|uniref:Uncharacterized protein n=1 Tax=Tribolium castaneum TaxID=7070 RepID=D2A3G6_TRICA|nr:hypothetical protein TcasGA2_TC007524 [Tribolium castaneum]
MTYLTGGATVFCYSIPTPFRKISELWCAKARKARDETAAARRAFRVRTSSCEHAPRLKREHRTRFRECLFDFSLVQRQFIARQIIRQPLINNSIPVQGAELRNRKWNAPRRRSNALDQQFTEFSKISANSLIDRVKFK